MIKWLKNLFIVKRVHELNSDPGIDLEPLLYYCPDGLVESVILTKTNPYCPKCGDKLIGK